MHVLEAYKITRKQACSYVFIIIRKQHQNVFLYFLHLLPTFIPQWIKVYCTVLPAFLQVQLHMYTYIMAESLYLVISNPVHHVRMLWNI